MSSIFDETEIISAVVASHGKFTTSRYHMDQMIMDYADMPIMDLLKIMGESFPEIDWQDVTRKIDCLFVLAEAHGYGL